MSNQPVLKQNLAQKVIETVHELEMNEKSAKTRLHVFARRQLADTVTPVSIYLKIRDHFGSGSALLESTDFKSVENCFSYIVLDPISTFQATGNNVTQIAFDGTKTVQNIPDALQIGRMLNDFVQSFEPVLHTDLPVFNGIFGHAAFDAVRYFDTLQFDDTKRTLDIPSLNYSLYRYIIAINHFKDELFIIQNVLEDEKPDFEKIESLLKNQSFGTYNFELVSEEQSNMPDEGYKELVRLGKYHCQIGDIFQIVPSRRFWRNFKGDDFNVYRVLRSINPSPYLFYFDFGNYKIFGSSPESQIVIKDKVASIHPIAGTYRRTGNDDEDRRRAEELTKDPKENAEHIMLVDLARNDLGRHANQIRVSEYREVHFYSHVIHLVSKVEGNLDENADSVQIFGDTFPAGTLSGAPKYKAIELINQYENCNRAFYGGAIGFIGFNGDMNQAITIRTFLSKDNTLYYQAGGGIVAASDEESELQEVNNKLGALKKALIEAEKI